MRPHQRIVLVTIVALVGGAAFLSAFLVTASTPESGLGEIATKLNPLVKHLNEVYENQQQANSTFFDAMATSDVAARTALIQAATQSTQAVEKAWRSYKSESVGLKGERALERQWETGAAANQAAAIHIFSTDGTTDPAGYAASIAALRKTGGEQIQVVETLRDRLYIPLRDAEITKSVRGLENMKSTLLWTFGLAVVLGLLADGFVLRGARTDEHRQDKLERERELQLSRSDLESRVQRGLEMTRTEEGSYAVITTAVEGCVPGRGAELLVADSSRAHFRQVLDLGVATRACSVSAPAECPAAHTGLVRVFPTNRAIDACPYLRGIDAPTSAACLPVSAAGRMIGVLHISGDADEPPSASAIESLRLVAQRAGEHIGLLRAMARSEAQAGTDTLTGLMNRRSVEAATHALVLDGTPFVVAFADLDHFKTLNDAHGHEAGDQALRLFARVLRDSVRPSDIPARFGGEEFVVVLPECSINDAVTVAERLRKSLNDTLANATVPPFTVSVGIARSGPDNGFSETRARADEALLIAKAEGRDRVVVFAGDRPLEQFEPNGGTGGRGPTPFSLPVDLDRSVRMPIIPVM